MLGVQGRPRQELYAYTMERGEIFGPAHWIGYTKPKGAKHCEWVAIFCPSSKPIKKLKNAVVSQQMREEASAVRHRSLLCSADLLTSP